MALRIEQHVARGEIDNRERGRVRGRIWFGGRDQPVVNDGAAISVQEGAASGPSSARRSR